MLKHTTSTQETLLKLRNDPKVRVFSNSGKNRQVVFVFGKRSLIASSRCTMSTATFVTKSGQFSRSLAKIAHSRSFSSSSNLLDGNKPYSGNFRGEPFDSLA